MLRAIYAFHRYVQRLERHRLQLRGRPATGASSRRAPAASTSPSWGRRRAATTSSRPAWRCSAASSGVPDLRGRAQRARAPAGVEALAARRPAAGQGDGAGQPGRRPLQPLSRRCARVSLPRIAGHRDGDSTDCPGDALYGELPRIRRSVAHAGRAPGAGDARAACPGALATAAPERPRRRRRRRAPPHPRAADGHSGASRRHARSPGAPIDDPAAQRRQRRAKSCASRRSPRRVTDAARRWSAAGERLAGRAGAGIWLRALCPGGAAGSPAAVSEPLHVPARRVASRRRALPRPRLQAARASRDVSPSSGTVRTSSVGAARSPAHSWHASLKASSIQASGRMPGVGVDGRELPVGVGCVPASARSAGTGSPAGSPSRCGRCSSARSSQPLAHTRSKCSARLEQVCGGGGRKEVGYAVDRVEGALAGARGPGRRPGAAPLSGGPEQRDDPVDVDHQQGLLGGSGMLVRLACRSETVFSLRTGWAGNLPVSAAGSKAAEDPADGPFSGSEGSQRPARTAHAPSSPCPTHLTMPTLTPRRSRP